MRNRREAAGGGELGEEAGGPRTREQEEGAEGSGVGASHKQAAGPRHKPLRCPKEHTQELGCDLIREETRERGRGHLGGRSPPRPFRNLPLLPQAEVLPPPPPRARGQGGPHLLDGAILGHSELLLLLRGLHGDFHDLGLRRGSGRGGAGTFGRGGAVLGARRTAAFTTLGHGGGGGDSGAQEGEGERGGASRRQSRPARAAENEGHAASVTTGARPPWQARGRGARCGLRRRPGSGAPQPPCVQTPLGRSDIRSRRRSSSSPPLPPRPSAGAAQGTPGNSAGSVAESCPAGAAAPSGCLSFPLPFHCSEGRRRQSGGFKAKWVGRDQFISSPSPKNKLGGSGRRCNGAL